MANWWRAFHHRPWGMLLPPQWFFAAGFALAGSQLHPGWWFIGAGVHIAWCALLAPHLNKSSVVPRSADQAWREKRANLLAELDADNQKRQEAVEQHAAAIARLLKRHGSDLAGTQADGMAQLCWQHLRLLSARSGAQAVRADAQLQQKLSNEHQALSQRLMGQLAPELENSLRERLELVEQRQAAQQEASARLELFDAELARIHTQLALAHEQALLWNDPAAIARTVDVLSQTLQQQQAWSREQQGLFSGLDEPVTPLGASAFLQTQ